MASSLLNNKDDKLGYVTCWVDACMENGTQLNYDPRNPFVVFLGQLYAIYQCQKFVSCPYCNSHFVPRLIYLASIYCFNDEVASSSLLSLRDISA
ncbi:coatomer subunit alpha-2 [Artemisia annua]|uniref:Coatomer subunit alpha-2 n=1 Tax=Artemisia annua TaxID=35608 RepID=A0A2U1MPD0_ARTAN|nr:coatomer subunit alpha-2 [Artemisia annua]